MVYDYEMRYFHMCRLHLSRPGCAAIKENPDLPVPDPFKLTAYAILFQKDAPTSTTKTDISST
jgi:hypothetical protein